MIRKDIVISNTARNFHIGHNVRITNNFAFGDSSAVLTERIIPKINRADRPVFDLPAAGSKKKEYVWVGANDGNLLRVDRESGTVKQISIGGSLQRVFVDNGFVYALDFNVGIISRVNKNTLKAVSVNVPSSGENGGLGADEDDVWYSTENPNVTDGTEFYTRRIAKTEWDGGDVVYDTVQYGFPTSLFVDENYIWVTNTLYLTPLEGIGGQAGVSSTTSAVVFNHPGASTVDDFYNKMDLWVFYGGWTGASEVRTIVDYDGATKTAFVSPPYIDTGGFFANPATWVWYKVRKYDMGRINKSSLAVTPVLIMERLTDIVADATEIWACSPNGQKVLRIAKGDFGITKINMGSFNPLTIADDGEDYVWVTDNKFGGQGVIRIDKSNLSFQKIAITETNFRAYGISLDSKYVWVTGEDDDRLVRITKSSEEFEQNTFILPSVTKCRGNMTNFAYKALVAA